MRLLLLIFCFSFVLCDRAGTTKPNNESKFEFSKAIYKVKGTIKKADSDFIIIPEGLKGTKFIPQYLPEEYKKNGLEVTFDGDLGKADATGTPLNIHKIWIAYELKEKYKIAHKSYDLN